MPMNPSPQTWSSTSTNANLKESPLGFLRLEQPTHNQCGGTLTSPRFCYQVCAGREITLTLEEQDLELISREPRGESGGQRCTLSSPQITTRYRSPATCAICLCSVISLIDTLCLPKPPSASHIFFYRLWILPKRSLSSST